ncbi:MAG: DUF2165 family protein [Pseudomonadota bacterium]
MMIRWLKIMLVVGVALWGLIGTLGNLMSLDAAFNSVQQVTSMEWLGDGDGPPWRTTNAIVAGMGVALIILGKLIAGVMCAFGAFRMVQSVDREPGLFQQAKRLAIVGAGAAFFMLFIGFTVIGETVYLMFFEPYLVGAAEAAWRYGGFIGLIMIFLAQPEPA